MSFYGKNTLVGKFTAHKMEVPAGTSSRFGGVHGQVAYDAVTGNQIEVVLHHSGVNVVTAGENIASTLLIIGVSPSTPAVISNIVLTDVADTLTLDENTYGVVLEGSATVDEVVLDASSSVPCIESGKTLTGSFKIVTFNYSQS